MSNSTTVRDMLQIIPDEDLFRLRDLYEDHQEWAPHIHSMFSMAIAWMKKAPHNDYLRFFSIGDDHLQTGTFILLFQFNCYDFFLFTLEESPENLCKALSTTTKFNWTKTTLFYAVFSGFSRRIREVLDSRQVRYYAGENCLFSISKKDALAFEISIPGEVYLGKVSKTHVKQINEAWPHKYQGSQGYIETFVIMNGGFGIFLRDSDVLVAWVVKNYFGQIGFLQTLDGYKRKGYAAILVKVLAKQIAEEGHRPSATVVKGSIASETLLRKLGFENIDGCLYIETNKR